MNSRWWKKRLQGDLPGEGAQQLMAPSDRGTFPDQGPAVGAAVLMLLYPAGDDTRLVFIKRNEYDGPHSGQVGFPGGAWEPGDTDLQHTALRETREEIGVGEDIEVVGALTPLHIPVSNYLVSPYVGWTEHTPVFRPDPSEVQYVIEASIKDLLDPVSRCMETWHRHGQPVETPFFRVGTEKVWGATAMMLSELLQVAARKQ
jgi:8-oxo-dGTP pyrophosphatase MutT (NUDIX family)